MSFATLSSLRSINDQLTNQRNNLENTLRYNSNMNQNYQFNNDNLRGRINSLNQYYTSEENKLSDFNTSLTNKLNTLNTDLTGYNTIKHNDISLNALYENTVIPNLENEYIDSFKRKVTSLLFFYGLISDENNKIDQRYKYIKNQFSRHDEKFDYYSKNIENLTSLNTIMFYLYYILVFICVIIMYLYKPDYSLYFKIISVILLLFYPFIVYTLEMVLYNAWIFIYSLLIGRVFDNLSYSKKVVLNNTTDLTTND